MLEGQIGYELYKKLGNTHCHWSFHCFDYPHISVYFGDS